MTTHLIYLIFTFHLVLCLGCVAPPSTAINSMPEVATTALSSATSIELISLNPDLNEEPKNDYHGFERSTWEGAPGDTHQPETIAPQLNTVGFRAFSA